MAVVSEAVSDDKRLRPALGRIIKNGLSVLAGNAGGEVLSSYAIVLSAVWLGPAGFGTLSSAQAFMVPFDALAGFGLGSIALTLAAQRGGADGTLRGTMLGLRMAFSSLAVMLAFLFAAITHRTEIFPVLIALAINTLLTPLTAVSLLPFQFAQAMHRQIYVPFVGSVIRFGTAYLAVWFYNTPQGHQLSGLSCGIAMCALLLYLAHRYYPSKFVFDRTVAKTLLAAAWAAAIMEVVVSMYLKGAYYFLRDAGPLAQGEYAAADRIVKPVLDAVGIFFVSSLPTVAILATEKRFTLLRGMYLRSVGRIVAVGVPVAAIVWVGAPLLLQRFAPQYAGATWPLRILLVGAVFMLVNHFTSVFLAALGRFRVIMVVAIINLCVFVSLATALVPKYGASGAAISTAITESINTVMQIAAFLYLLSQESKRA